MVTYVVNYTDDTKTPINIEEKTVDQNLPIALFGRQKLEYGELMNENILHLLENFACPQDPLTISNDLPAQPDLSQALDFTLQNAINGQLWFNSTNKLLYVRSNDQWVPLSLAGEVAANYGTITHGQQLPLPVADSGYVFDYDECCWMVSPFNYPDEINFMRCHTDTDDSTVTMQFTLEGGGSTVYNGTVNYMIIGIRGNVNLGDNVGGPVSSPTPTPDTTPTPTTTSGLTPTVTPTMTVTPSITPTNSPPPTVTPTNTPATSAEPLGQGTRLYASPTVGDPGRPENLPSQYAAGWVFTGSINLPPEGETYHYNSCAESIRDKMLGRKSYISLQGINGGHPPYTVDFTNVIVSDISSVGSVFYAVRLGGPPDPNWYSIPHDCEPDWTYRGGNGSFSNPVRTNVNPDELCYVEVKQVKGGSSLDWPSENYTVDTTNFYIELSGYVNVIDNIGQSRRWYISNNLEFGGTNCPEPCGSTSTIKWQFRTYAYCPDCLASGHDPCIDG